MKVSAMMAPDLPPPRTPLPCTFTLLQYLFGCQVVVGQRVTGIAVLREGETNFYSVCMCAHSRVCVCACACACACVCLCAFHLVKDMRVGQNVLESPGKSNVRFLLEQE